MRILVAMLLTTLLLAGCLPKREFDLLCKSGGEVMYSGRVYYKQDGIYEEVETGRTIIISGAACVLEVVK